MNVYLPNLRLPSEYQEVEYIQSSWTQRIDTWYSYGWWWYLRIDAKFMFNSVPTSNSDFIYWVIWRSSNNRFLWINYNSWNTFQFASWTEYSTNIGWTTWIIYDTMMKYEWWTMTMKVNNSTLSISSTWNMYQGHSLPIFCRWDNWNQIYDYPSKIKLYSFKIYTSWTTLVRDFIPCYRKSDSVIWLYDLVNNQFYTNAWTGTFSKGNDVTMAVLKNAYIGEWTPYTPTSDTLAYYPLNWNLKDYSWNWHNGTWSTGTAKYNTLSSWLKVAEFSWWVSRVTTTFSGTPKTVSLWVYKSTSLSDPFVNTWKWIAWQNIEDNWTWWLFRLINSSARPNKVIYQNGNYDSYRVEKTESYYDKWINLVITNSWSTSLFYVNWVYVGSVSNNISTWGSLWIGTTPYDTSANNTLYWYVSDLILENIVWNSTKITNYYNQTKSNYWL